MFKNKRKWIIQKLENGAWKEIEIAEGKRFHTMRRQMYNLNIIFPHESFRLSEIRIVIDGISEP